MTIVGKDTVTEGTQLEAVRRHNLATVLRIVHSEGAVSRSALTHVTGLNRSTVGGIVSRLSESHLVEEREPIASNRVGRPSPLVVPNSHVVAFAVNPEVDAITVAVVGFNAHVAYRRRYSTQTSVSAIEAVAITAELIREIESTLPLQTRVVGVGVALPGLVRQADGLVRLAPHLGWSDVPFATLLSGATGYSVWVANDASLGAHAEHIFGAGRGIDNLVYLNGGPSGIGGGVIVAGSPLVGVNGYAGEFGHMMVNSEGLLCHCGARGCLETEVSQESLYDVLGVEPGDRDDLTAMLTAAISGGNLAVFSETIRQMETLAHALRAATNIFNPDRIILGGFLSALFACDPDRMTRMVASESLAMSSSTLTITQAVLGADILMIGAADLAFAHLLEDPLGSQRTVSSVVVAGQ